MIERTIQTMPTYSPWNSLTTVTCRFQISKTFQFHRGKTLLCRVHPWFRRSGSQLFGDAYLSPIDAPGTREIDPTETVRIAARTGRILKPAMRMLRANDAKLLMLVDVGYGMAPWSDFIDNLLESLENNKKQAGMITTSFFASAPGHKVYGTRDLTKPIDLLHLLREMGHAPVLVFGQAGVLGSPQRHLSTRLDIFFSRVTANDLKPLVWINPMPRARWRAGEMPRILTQPNTTAFELNPESLLRAVDVLRGVI